MYFCTNCGQSNSDEITICPNCGSIKPSYLSNQSTVPNVENNIPDAVAEQNIETTEVNQVVEQPVPEPDVQPQFNEQPQFTPQPAFAPQPMQMQQPMGQPAFTPQPMQMQQPMYGNGQQFAKPKTNIAKLIFEMAALICSLLVIAQLFMPLISVERGKYEDEISVYDAIINSIDSFEDLDLEEDDNNVIFALVASVSSLLGLLAIVSAITVFIAKIIALVKINKSEKIKLSGIYSLFSLQLAYLLFGNLLLFTDNTTVKSCLRTDMEFEMMIGWTLPTIIIALTALYGVIIGFIFNKKEIDNLFTPKNIVNALFGVVAAIVSCIAVFTSVSVWYEVGKVEMTTSGTVYTLYLIFYDAVKEYVEFEEILPFISMVIGAFLLNILTFIMFDTTLKNSIISIANKKFSSISCCVMSIVSLISIFVNTALFDMIEDLEIEYEAGYELTFNTSTKSMTSTLIILAIVLLILSIIHIVLNNTVFTKKSVPMQNMNPYMQMNGMNNMNGMPNMQYGNMPINNMNGFNNVPNGQFQNPNQNQPMNYK